MISQISRQKKKKTLRLRFRGTGQNIFSCSVKRVLTHLKVWPRQRGFRGRRKFEDYINLAISGPVAVLNNGILFFTILKSDQPWHREFVAKDDKHVKSRCHCFQVARYKEGKEDKTTAFSFLRKMTLLAPFLHGNNKTEGLIELSVYPPCLSRWITLVWLTGTALARFLICTFDQWKDLSPVYCFQFARRKKAASRKWRKLCFAAVLSQHFPSTCPKND